MKHNEEVQSGQRFSFGANWSRFLKGLDESQMQLAKQSLCNRLGIKSLADKSVIDVGSGSGLFSLSAKRLGACVHSFDYDPQSVACTAELRRRYFPDSKDWTIEEASVLDENHLAKLGQYDVVYSWGVLHHTGHMSAALTNVASLVRPGGKLFIAIYNDQGWLSQYWLFVKRLYNKNLFGKVLMVLLHLPYLFGARYFARAITGRLSVERGMSLWYDMLDWLGGYPFEVATPEQIILFYRRQGFVLENLQTCRGRHGCNEFVFSKMRSESSMFVAGDGR